MALTDPRPDTMPDAVIPTPLDLAEWRARTMALGQGAAEGEWTEQGECLREAYALLTLAPRGLGAWLAALPAQATFDAMLAAGCWESAAAALLPQDAAWMVSRAPEGDCLASVLLPGDGEGDEASAPGASPALALVAALTSALLNACPSSVMLRPGDAIDLRSLPRATGWLH